MKPHLLERDEEGELKVQQVWHGTGKFPAHNIYEDRKVNHPIAFGPLDRTAKHVHLCVSKLKGCGWSVQDGFMMQFAHVGQWGDGLYFSQDASYSHFYASAGSSGPGHNQPPVVSCHDIAGVWVAFFQECQRYRCGQGG